ncbi:MAG: ATP-binding cassette domain-containing protein [Actinomycetota bacterium]|jgi:ABC-2 type transport system ATP-binding protein|nr:ATP-binding cassette domain-containing protein [Actinomycetota bacterium]
MGTIEATGLSKAYDGKLAVDGLSFRVDPGSVTGFLGPNGSGKSTTMRLMLGLDNGQGSTTFDGSPFRQLRDPMRHVGSLLEAKPFHPTRKARNHLRLLAAPNGISDARVDEVLEMVGLTSVAADKPRKFSLGMGQRLGIAAALLGDPHTLILDEPANGLDPQGIQWLRQLLKDLAGEGRSVFVSSHLLAEMALMADRLVVIGRGRLLASGPVDDFVKASRSNAIVLRTPDIELLGPVLGQRGAYLVGGADGAYVVTGMAREQIGDVAHEVGARLHELASREATLEEAFLEATGMSEEFIGHAGALSGEPGSYDGTRA